MPVVFDFPEYRIGLIFISSSFFGAFVVLFSLSTLILHQPCKKSAMTLSSSTTVYLTLSYLMFFDLAAVWVISIIMCFKPSTVEGPNIGRVPTPTMFAQYIVGFLASLIGDTVMAYRLYIIWDRIKVILWIATLLILLSIGLIILIIVHYARHGIVLFTPIMILGGITIGANITFTSLIAWRIWKKHRLTRAVGGQKIIIQLLAIIAESSVLYTTWVLGFLVSHLTSHFALEIFIYGHPHMAGIASMLINVRVGLGWALGEEGRSTRSLHNSAFARSRIGYDLEADEF